MGEKLSSLPRVTIAARGHGHTVPCGDIPLLKPQDQEFLPQGAAGYSVELLGDLDPTAGAEGFQRSPILEVQPRLLVGAAGLDLPLGGPQDGFRQPFEAEAVGPGPLGGRDDLCGLGHSSLLQMVYFY